MKLCDQNLNSVIQKNDAIMIKQEVDGKQKSYISKRINYYIRNSISLNHVIFISDYLNSMNSVEIKQNHSNLIINTDFKKV